MKTKQAALRTDTGPACEAFSPDVQLSSPEERITVLVASTFDSDLISLLGILGHTAWNISWWPAFADAAEALRAGAAPVVLCDEVLPDGTWSDLLRAARSNGHAPRVLVCSGRADDSLWTEVLENGGFDVLAKPFAAHEVFRSVSAAYRAWQLERARGGFLRRLRRVV